MSPFTERFLLFDSGLLRICHYDLDTHSSIAKSATRFARTGVTSAAASVLSCRWRHLSYSRFRIPNQLIVTTCGLHVSDTFNHSLVIPFASYLGLRINLRTNLRLRFFGFAISLLQLRFFPVPSRSSASGGLPRTWKLSLPYSLELA